MSVGELEIRCYVHLGQQASTLVDLEMRGVHFAAQHSPGPNPDRAFTEQPGVQAAENLHVAAGGFGGTEGC